LKPTLRPKQQKRFFLASWFPRLHPSGVTDGVLFTGVSNPRGQPEKRRSEFLYFCDPPNRIAIASTLPAACRRETEIPPIGAAELASELEIDFYSYGAAQHRVTGRPFATACWRKAEIPLIGAAGTGQLMGGFGFSLRDHPHLKVIKHGLLFYYYSSLLAIS
jgi:hypothetical protein